MTRSDDELQVYAETHIAQEILMLTELPRLRSRTVGLVNDAVYEAFLVHLRNLDTFIRSIGRTGEAKASDYSRGWTQSRSAAPWRQTINRQVAHLLWDRKRPGVDGAPAPLISRDESTAIAELAVDFHEFYRALSADTQVWFAAIPRCFSEVRP